MTQETFERELARRADEVHGAPFSVEDVRGRARQIRRRRAGATAVAAAAVVAAVAVVPTLLSGGSHRSAPDPAPAPPSGHVAVLHDGTVTTAGGATVPLPVDNKDVTQLGVLTDGRVVLAMQRPQVIRVYGADGTLRATYRPTYNQITMSVRDDAVAWVGRDLKVRVLSSGAAEPTELGGIPMPGEAAGTIDAVLDADHLLVGDGTTTEGELTPDGYTELQGPEPFRVADVTPDGDLWAVTFVPEGDQQYGCTGLYDPATRQVLKRSCDVYPLGFAPDGKHLLTGYLENNMASDVKVVDLDLEPVGGYTPDDGTAVSRVAWSDADNLLVVSAGLADNSWSVQRVGLDGSDPEVLGGPTKGGNPEMVLEYLLSS